jgi:hypothetical protein
MSIVDIEQFLDVGFFFSQGEVEHAEVVFIG